MCEYCGDDNCGDASEVGADISAQFLSRVMGEFLEATDSAGYLVTVIDKGGRPWCVLSACREESGVDSTTMLSDHLLKLVDEHWPTDDAVQVDVRYRPEDTKKGITRRRQLVAEKNFKDTQIKN